MISCGDQFWVDYRSNVFSSDDEVVDEELISGGSGGAVSLIEVDPDFLNLGFLVLRIWRSNFSKASFPSIQPRRLPSLFPSSSPPLSDAMERKRSEDRIIGSALRGAGG